jgi:uncharacterized membrane protein YfcA
MSALAVGAAAFLAACLTFFSGFGLGTLLLPVFAVFFPAEVAVGATAVVHLANNLFKGALVRRSVDRPVAVRFGLPAMIAALAGAWLLERTTSLAPLFSYELAGRTFRVAPLQLLLGILMLSFAALELVPNFRSLAIDRKYVWLGGALSGFFGGLSGHQGALRSMFLVKLGLSKEAYVATGVFVAILVDLSRLAVYGASWGRDAGALAESPGLALLAVAIASALAGSVAGNRLLPKITLGFVQSIVGILLIVYGVGFAAGWIG